MSEKGRIGRDRQSGVHIGPEDTLVKLIEMRTSRGRGDQSLCCGPKHD